MLSARSDTEVKNNALRHSTKFCQILADQIPWKLPDKLKLVSFQEAPIRPKFCVPNDFIKEEVERNDNNNIYYLQYKRIWKVKDNVLKIGLLGNALEVNASDLKISRKWRKS